MSNMIKNTKTVLHIDGAYPATCAISGSECKGL
jgi:hypothetical protein